MSNSESKYSVKSTYARQGASLKLAPSFWRGIFTERLPRISAPLFFGKGCSCDKWYLKGVPIWKLH